MSILSNGPIRYASAFPSAYSGGGGNSVAGSTASEGPVSGRGPPEQAVSARTADKKHTIVDRIKETSARGERASTSPKRVGRPPASGCQGGPAEGAVERAARCRSAAATATLQAMSG